MSQLIIYYDNPWRGVFIVQDDRQSDQMVLRLEQELEERNSFLQGLIAQAQDQNRDLTESESELMVQARARVGVLDNQLKLLYDTRETTMRARTRATEVHRAMQQARDQVDNGPVEYRSAGAFVLDQWLTGMGDSNAKERLELYTRAAAHQKTSDNLGVIPDPVVGNVLNFIDASRPAVSVLGPQPLPSATWYRPKVTQRTLVGVQGSAGAAADEKSELSSQKMTITRLTGNAVTYGGYVNVSRQDIDFSSPNMLDIIINDLAAQYAIQTEAALCTALQASANTIELATASGGTPSAADLTGALWSGVAAVYAATKGIGRPVLVVPTSRLANWASVFSPVNPQNAQSTGFNAADFGSGLMGNISGIPVYCSAQYPTVANNYGALLSTAAVEVYETRIGALQVIEPSVLGVQVAYAGYFTPMTVESGGVQRIVNLS